MIKEPTKQFYSCLEILNRLEETEIENSRKIDQITDQIYDLKEKIETLSKKMDLFTIGTMPTIYNPVEEIEEHVS